MEEAGEEEWNGEVSKRGQNNISIIAVFVQTFLLVMTTGVKWVVNAAGSGSIVALNQDSSFESLRSVKQQKG